MYKLLLPTLCPQNRNVQKIDETYTLESVITIKIHFTHLFEWGCFFMDDINGFTTSLRFVGMLTISIAKGFTTSVPTHELGHSSSLTLLTTFFPITAFEAVTVWFAVLPP